MTQEDRFDYFKIGLYESKLSDVDKSLVHHVYKAALKDVGEWGNKRVMCEHYSFYHKAKFCDSCWESLRNGKLPEEVSHESDTK